MFSLPVRRGLGPVRSMPAFPLAVIASSFMSSAARAMFVKVPLTSLVAEKVCIVEPGASSISAAARRARSCSLEALSLPLRVPGPASATSPV